MRYWIILILLGVLTSCNQGARQTQEAEAEETVAAEGLYGAEINTEKLILGPELLALLE